MSLFFCLVGLIEIVEFSNQPGTNMMSNPGTTLSAAALTAAVWSMDLLPISFVIGGVIAISDLQNHREFIVAKASGISIWGLVRAPVIFAILLGLTVSYALDPVILKLNDLVDAQIKAQSAGSAAPTRRSGWIEQDYAEGRYIIKADQILNTGDVMNGVRVFMLGGQGGDNRQIEAEQARYENFAWTFIEGTISSPGQPVESFKTFSLPTSFSAAQLQLQLGAISRMSIFELKSQLRDKTVTTPAEYVAQMRMRRLEALPIVLVGTLLIAFAFTSGYSRMGTSGTHIIYGILLGFVVYILTKLADRAGESGNISALLAAWGPAIVAIVIGTTVLLLKEDG
ncbi:LptF/LptG family permease [Maritalea sp. P4.10X]|uniref:LptF/LptG family permease n=2 Tax=Maritalea mediterranea TaxID=2909667 RepID=A0ABS9E5F6_9HYPH|nr:LptF/LptG family permease [Maritalea mediterranea]